MADVWDGEPGFILPTEPAGMVLTYETLGLVLATAAIALGLDKEQSSKFISLVYSRTRNRDAPIKYEIMIQLAYDIKTGKV